MPAERGTSSRFAASHWREPLENTLGYAQDAREGLIAVGDVQFAGYTYFASLPARLDCAPSLDSFAEETDSAIDFALRTNVNYLREAYLSYRALVRTLRDNVFSGKR